MNAMPHKNITNKLMTNCSNEDSHITFSSSDSLRYVILPDLSYTFDGVWQGKEMTVVNVSKSIYLNKSKECDKLPIKLWSNISIVWCMINEHQLGDT